MWHAGAQVEERWVEITTEGPFSINSYFNKIIFPYDYEFENKQKITDKFPI